MATRQVCKIKMAAENKGLMREVVIARSSLPPWKEIVVNTGTYISLSVPLQPAGLNGFYSIFISFFDRSRTPCILHRSRLQHPLSDCECDTPHDHRHRD